MSGTDEIRVRFAPSPTGYLHIGSARTALFNYLFARHHGGKLVLRIEDTDQERSTVDSLKNIIEGLLWLNIEWDEGPVYDLPPSGNDFDSTGPYGPYFQAKRTGHHREYCEKLVEGGHAYYCKCPPSEEAGASKCRCKVKQDEVKSHSKLSVKFAIPKGTTIVNDLILGEVVFENDTIEDFLIMRPSGFATYNFAAVCDDHDMNITHVLRGADHLSNTPKQIMMLNALGLRLPKFGHIPLIHGDDGVRLSKRHGAVSVRWYRDEGFLPEAVVNYLARLGWSDGTDEEFFTLDELEKKFDLDGVAKSPAQFDMDKLIWFNGKYIRQLDDDSLFELALPYLVESGAVKAKGMTPGRKEWLKVVLGLYRDRMDYFREVPEKTAYFFTDPKEYLLSDLEKAKVDAEAMGLLGDLLKIIEKTSDFTVDNLENLLRGFCEEKGVKLGRVVHPLRLAVTGGRASPGMFETLRALGKKRVVRRLGRFVRKVKPVDL
jgi:glutamyl-tRNA synthetase